MSIGATSATLPSTPNKYAASRTSAFHEGEHAEYGAHGTLRRIIVEFQKAVIERYRPANPPYRVSKTAVTLRPERNAMA